MRSRTAPIACTRLSGPAAVAESNIHPRSLAQQVAALNEMDNANADRLGPVSKALFVTRRQAQRITELEAENKRLRASLEVAERVATAADAWRWHNGAAHDLDDTIEEFLVFHGEKLPDPEWDQT